MRPEDLLDIPTVYARDLSEELSADADRLLALTHQRRVENERLENLRDALSPELLSGRLRVPEAQAAIADLVG